MSRRSLKNRFNRKIVAIGDSFGLTFPIEHIDELDWKKGKEVKTKVIDGYWVVCDKSMDFDALTGNTTAQIDTQALAALSAEVEALKKQVQDEEAKTKKAKAKIKELETKLNQQQGNLF